MHAPITTAGTTRHFLHVQHCTYSSRRPLLRITSVGVWVGLVLRRERRVVIYRRKGGGERDRGRGEEGTRLKERMEG